MSSATESGDAPRSARDVRSLLFFAGVLVLAAVLARWHSRSIAMHYDPAFAAARIDVNAAAAAELAELPGIGVALAQRMVAARTEGGRFRDVDDLVARVRGLGDRSATELGPLISFGEGNR